MSRRELKTRRIELKNRNASNSKINVSDKEEV